MARRGRRSKQNPSTPSAIQFTGSLTRQVARMGRLPQAATDIQDNRRSHPLEYFRPNLTTWGGLSEGVTPKKQTKFKRPVGMPSGLQFKQADDLLVCVRRKRRKEVLFATKKTGKGSRSRKRRRNRNSDISC